MKEKNGGCPWNRTCQTLASGYSTVGSACLATNKGILTHFNTTDEEMKIIEDALKTKGNRGSVNFGTDLYHLAQ